MIIPQAHGRRLPNVLLSVIRQDCYAKPVAWTQPSSPDPCTESAAEPFRLEQAMIPQQAVSNDPLSPHTPSPLPADADATVTGTDIVYLADPQPQRVEWRWQHRLAAGTLAMISGEPGSGKTWVASPHCAPPNSISAFVAPKTENLVPGGGLCPRRRTSTRRSTRQDAQINYLSTLSIFMKQTTYLATLPNPNLKANECPCF
jgi:hypothetical protein